MTVASPTYDSLVYDNIFGQSTEHEFEVRQKKMQIWGTSLEFDAWVAFGVNAALRLLLPIATIVGTFEAVVSYRDLDLRSQGMRSAWQRRPVSILS